MSASKPEIVLVPGAFGTPAGFNKLVKHLALAGFSTHGAPYPSCNPSEPATSSAQVDIDTVRDNTLLPLLEEGKDLIIIAHSYGGVVAGAAAKDLDKPTRLAAGHNSSIVGLIYVVGNITLENESLLDAIGGAYPPFIKQDKPSKGLALIEPAMDILYSDIDAKFEPELSKHMQPHAFSAFETKPSAPAWADKGFDGRRAYIRTLNDNCNPTAIQDVWIEKTQVKWDVVDFQSGHMPFESRPEELAQEVIKFINAFSSL